MTITQLPRKMANRFAFFLSAFAILILGGCASGGYKITRQYARFVNKQNIIIRILLYIFTSFVFAITLLADFVLFNTIDFWEGKVSASEYQYQEKGVQYYVKHSFEGEQKLRKSEIVTVSLEESNLANSIIIQETQDKKIELYQNGELKASVSDIHSLPFITTYSEGKSEKRPLFLEDFTLKRMASLTNK